MNSKNNKTKQCSFCGHPASSERKIIQGPNATICEECIKFSHQFLESAINEVTPDFDVSHFESPPLPHEIKNHLDKHIVGQDHAKKVLAVATYNHYKRVYLNQVNSQSDTEQFTNDVILEKSNVLMIGPTGSGKTLLAKTLADFLHVPFAIADATTLTEAGYVGEDVENVLLKLYKAADNDIEKAKYGIIFIDEIDKVSRRSKSPSITRDVSGEGVQQALLKIIEGTVASIPPQGGRKHPQQQNITLDTTNILFICGGAFIGLEDIINSRVADNTMGFGQINTSNGNKEQTKQELLDQIHPDDLINFGLVPEFVGRLPVITTLESHSIETLKSILIEPQNSIVKQFQYFFQQNNVDLIFEEKTIDLIAKQAYIQNTGARGLRSIVEKILLDTMFEAPKIKNLDQVIVTPKSATDKKAPEYIYKEELISHNNTLEISE